MSAKKSLTVFIILLAIIGISSGCMKKNTFYPDSSQDDSLHEESSENDSTSPMIYPINDIKGKFLEVSGWVNDHEILYITEKDRKSQVNVYDFNSGESRLFYESKDPIINIVISPSKKHLLIHSSPIDNVGDLKFFKLDGLLQYETSIESFDMEFVWNQNNEDQIIVTAFYEDWSYSAFTINMKEKSMTEVELMQPFVHWPTTDDLLYLNWELDSSSLQAPLIKESIYSKSQQEILASAHYFDSFNGITLAVQTNVQDLHRANYIFMNNQFEEMARFDVPQLATFTGWLVPYYDLNPVKKTMIYFVPLSAGEADIYSGGFSLAKYSVKDGKEVVLFSDLENQPISCTSDEKYCLYGFQFEKLIDLKQKEIINLVK